MAENETMDPDSVAHHFVHTKEEKPQPVQPERSWEEKERRELQRRFKRLRGYKPTTKDLDELSRMVVAAERAAGIY